MEDYHRMMTFVQCQSHSPSLWRSRVGISSLGSVSLSLYYCTSDNKNVHKMAAEESFSFGLRCDVPLSFSPLRLKRATAGACMHVLPFLRAANPTGLGIVCFSIIQQLQKSTEPERSKEMSLSFDFSPLYSSPTLIEANALSLLLHRD